MSSQSELAQLVSMQPALRGSGLHAVDVYRLFAQRSVTLIKISTLLFSQRSESTEMQWTTCVYISDLLQSHVDMGV